VRAAGQQRWVITDLGVLPGRWSGDAVAINERAQVVGSNDQETFERGYRAFLWQKGRLTNLGTVFPGYPEAASQAIDINDRGEIIGKSWRHHLSPAAYGFIWRNGRLRRLEPGSKEAWTIAEWISSVPVAVNNRGQVAGTYAVSAEYTHAVRWTNGRTIDLGTLPGRPWSEAVAINERGWIVGTSYANNDPPSGEYDRQRAFVWHDGTRIALGTLPGTTETWPGGDGPWAGAINLRGQIVGSCTRGPFVGGGKMTDLGGLRGFADSQAVAINDRGQIIGTSGSSDGPHRAFLWQNGRMIDLGTLGGTKSDAVAINERGQVVGSSTTASGARHAFVWQNGKMTDLGTLGGRESAAAAINDRGQIVGSSQTAKTRKSARLEYGLRHPVLWTLR
jgi:probable HAF family extracellular repeat protein